MADERWKECKHHYEGCACREHAWAEQVARLTAELDVEKSNYECLKGEWDRAVALAQEHCPEPVLGQAWLTDGIPLLAELAKRSASEVGRLIAVSKYEEREVAEATRKLRLAESKVEELKGLLLESAETIKELADLVSTANGTIPRLEAEVERLKAKPTVAQVRSEMVGKIIAMINECYAAQDGGFHPIWSEHAIALDRALEVVRGAEAEVERLREAVKTAHADGASALVASFENTDPRARICELEAEVERLRAHTWEQEREAIVKFLLTIDCLPCSFNNPDLLPQIAGAIKRNDHWTGIAEESLKEYRKMQEIIDKAEAAEAEVERLKAKPVVAQVVTMPTDYDRSIHSNPDAHAWAKFFCETFPGSDEALMIGWFANAMMAMHDHLKQTDSTAEVERLKGILQREEK